MRGARFIFLVLKMRSLGKIIFLLKLKQFATFNKTITFLKMPAPFLQNLAEFKNEYIVS